MIKLENIVASKTNIKNKYEIKPLVLSRKYTKEGKKKG